MSPGNNNISHHVCLPTASSSQASGPCVYGIPVLKEHTHSNPPRLLVVGALDSQVTQFVLVRSVCRKATTTSF